VREAVDLLEFLGDALETLNEAVWVVALVLLTRACMATLLL